MARTPLDVLSLHRTDFVDIIAEDIQTAQILEEIGEERVNESLLQMSFFHLIEDLMVDNDI